MQNFESIEALMEQQGSEGEIASTTVQIEPLNYREFITTPVALISGFGALAIAGAVIYAGGRIAEEKHQERKVRRSMRLAEENNQVHKG